MIDYTFEITDDKIVVVCGEGFDRAIPQRGLVVVYPPMVGWAFEKARWSMGEIRTFLATNGAGDPGDTIQVKLPPLTESESQENESS